MNEVILSSNGHRICGAIRLLAFVDAVLALLEAAAADVEASPLSLRRLMLN